MDGPKVEVPMIQCGFYRCRLRHGGGDAEDCDLLDWTLVGEDSDGESAILSPERTC